jgi:DNA (cytosine-5)-methyltransferase 1
MPVKSGSSKAVAGFRFIDLFAGIGGLRRAFEGIGGHCVFTSELNEKAVETYRANFATDHPIAGDICAVPNKAIPAFDVLLAGFPCQPFSISGVSKRNALGRAHGFQCKTQGTLFFEIERILRAHRPAAFLLENVKNLVGHDGGRTFETIRRVLHDDLGYDLKYRVLDARYLVPQHRERIFIVGFREPTSFSFDDVVLPEEGPRLGSILHPEDGTQPVDEPFTEGPQARVPDKYGLSPRLWKYLQDYAAKHKAAGNGFGFGLVGPHNVARTLSARYHKDGSEILIDRPGRTPRRLTPRECARLMGFDAPDGQSFNIPVSDTQAYRQFGNSVVVPLVSAVARAMRPHIEHAVAPPALVAEG